MGRSCRGLWRTWKRYGELKLLAKTVDLKSAYKQFAIRPEDRKRQVITVKSPKDGATYGFVGHMLPFGAAAAVMAFNRVSRLVWRLGVECGLMLAAYFDDFPVLETSALEVSASSAARALFDLLGIRCSLDKEHPFSQMAALVGVVLDLTSARDGEIKVANKPELDRGGGRDSLEGFTASV